MPAHSGPPEVSRAHFFRLLALLLSMAAGCLLGTPLAPPPRARQFVDKRSSASRVTVAELIRTNPLLASLAMFRESSELLQEPVDITSNSLAVQPGQPTAAAQNSSSSSSRSRIGRRKSSSQPINAANQSKQSLAANSFTSLSALGSVMNSSLPQLDNFEPLYQVFNATLFDMAVPLELEREKAAMSDGDPETTLWRLALPWGMVERSEQQRQRQDNWQNSKTTSTKTMTTTSSTTRPSPITEKEEHGPKPLLQQREGRLIDQQHPAEVDGNSVDGLVEEPGSSAESPPPFEVTETLELALSTAPSPPATDADDGQRVTTTTETALIGQEEFPMDKLAAEPGRAWKYPWERQRGEKPSANSTSSPVATTTASSSLLLAPFPPMPGASFYVDQHVSHGPFGREPEGAPELVYDPNVLQSRYGYTGMLPQMTADGQLVRYGQPKGRRHFGVAQQQRAAPVQPPTALSLVPAAAIFFIPAPPRLSMARAVPPLPSRAHGQPTLGNRKRPAGFWPSKSTQGWEEEDTEEQEKTTSARTTTKMGPMTPMGGNSLMWIPLDKAEKLASRAAASGPFEEFGEASKFPCLVDPAEMVLSDSPPELGAALAGCFRRIRQCVFHMARPLERRVGLALSECVRLCVGMKQCQSLVYARPNAICDIFDARNGSGTGRLLHHRDFDYLEPLKSSPNTNLSECWHANSPGNGSQSAEHLGHSHGSETSPNGTTGQGQGSDDQGKEGTRDTCSTERDIVVFKSQGYRLADRRKQRAAVGEPPPADGQSIRVPGQQSSETECIFSCLVNLARGRSPFECLAATFDQVQGRCLLYGPGSAADGSVHLVPDPSFAHYEKGCIHSELVELCQGLPIARYPQKTLLGFALASRRTSSLIECLEQCWLQNNSNDNRTRTANEGSTEEDDADVKGGEQRQKKCRSVVFFYEESGGHNCMLNTESRDSAPAFFVDENEALVDYASFDGCFRLGMMEEKVATMNPQHLEGPENVAVLTPKKKKEPRLLRLRPLPERRRKPDQKRIYYTKNAGQAGRPKAAEKRLARLVDSDGNQQDHGSTRTSKRHGGETGPKRKNRSQQQQKRPSSR